MVSTASAAIRLSLFIAWTLLCLVPYLLLMILRAEGGLCLFYWRIVCRITGLNVAVFGQMTTERPALFVSNHVSYLDILVLGGLIRASFVAKSEVAGWPGINIIARLGRTIFVERRPVRAAKQTGQLARRLLKGDSLIVFPEGTSTDGNRLMPFKSTLFSAAEIEINGQPVLVQPLTITYTRLNGMPMGRVLRPLYAWYGDMSLAPHLWKVLGLGQAQVEVEFHPPVRLTDYATRKGLALHCHRAVRHGLSRGLSGRRDEPVRTKAPQSATVDAHG
ncbi:MAG: 1-acyl-sn-glycerol-3-phosphate acyltransferase [Alphaproteobacteria bacterium]|nr:1-acyl-sn-glycerol-3-phosphate acyltransferase [Alphaproteobacteria bacterium]